MLNDLRDIEVVKYDKSYYNDWNNFILNAKNATFLFYRDFMEYHKDRFEDFSLLLYKKNKLIAVLPGNRVGDKVYSHLGLSYGGFIIQDIIRFEDYVFVVKRILQYLEKRNIEKLYLKRIPFIYQSTLSEEIDYILAKLDATIEKSDSYFVIDNSRPYKPNRNRSRAIKKAKILGASISTEGIDYFWEHILKENLLKKFKVKPVHSIDEIKLLIKRFPEQIKFFSVVINNKIEASVVMFICKEVAHFQYSSANENRSENGAIDYLFDYIIKHYNNKKYISFGSSSTDKSLKINKGLAYWKESFGAKLMCQNTYFINTKNHNFIKNVFQ